MAIHPIVVSLSIIIILSFPSLSISMVARMAKTYTKATLCNSFTFNNTFTIIPEDTYNHITVVWSFDVA